MMRTRRPRSVDKRVMEILLNVIDDLANIQGRIIGVQSTARGCFADGFLMSRTDRRLDIREKQRNDSVLISGGYFARCLASLALYRTRLTGPHSLLHDQMVAAEEPAAEGTQAPASRRRFAATCRTRDFKWNREHLSALLQERSPEPG